MRKLPCLVLFLFSCLFSVSFLAAQTISIGIKGGLPLTQAFDAQTNPNVPTLSAILGQGLFGLPDSSGATERTVPYTIGPAIEVRLAKHIKAEADALYSRAVYDWTDIITFGLSAGTHYYGLKNAVDRVQIPVLVKYEFGKARARPFAGAGVSLLYSRDRVVQGVLGSQTNVSPPNFGQAQQSNYPVESSIVAGPTATAGAVTTIRRVRLSAEIRYARLSGNTVTLGLPAGSPGNLNGIEFITVNAVSHLLQPHENQMNLLIGILF